MPKCDGIFITSYTHEHDHDHVENGVTENFANKLFNEYNDYKIDAPFPTAIKGTIYC